MEAVPVGNHFVSIYPIPAGITTIVDPAKNTHGVTLRTGYIAPSNGAVDLYCGQVAPTMPGDRTVPIIFSGNGNSAAGSHSEVVLPYPLFIPAGKGLWLGTSVPASTPRPAGIALTWDFLG
ncbi:hypothetical protein H7A76_07010 [Pseudomonas sp. MSSRFD41]|uniref:hypothetical protein n=1 Tax=Pseudomonas sp. MSSRFD41 TaxID=1310370 RepID=UPI0016395387|nr:hypothetical protein [Pseudomonas sp. MSSRFD41]MBC2655184.1 hypothetical protein [Pseudomonas sp. MSSRFD41]